MRKRVLLTILASVLLCACLIATACDKYEPQSNEEDAAKYYQEKYGVKAEVDDAHGLGNYNLFGYSYSGMEYIMSDGVSVVYFDSEGVFRDNRQAAEIQAAANAFVQGKVEAIPGALTPVKSLEVGYEPSYETYKGTGVCWHERYDGDIEAFLAQERPTLEMDTYTGGDSNADGRFWYAMAYDAEQGAAAEDAWLTLARYVNVRGITLAVVDRTAYQAAGEAGLTLFDDGLRYTISFSEEDNGRTTAKHFKPAFVKLFDGATITSMTAEVTLSEGDVSFEPLDRPGFYRCRVSGQAAAHTGGMEYFVRNDSANGIMQVRGADQLSLVCDSFQHRNYVKLYDGETYFIGDLDVIKPRIEIESVTATTVRVRYYTYFKDEIRQAKMRVIAMAQKQNGSVYESTEFPSRIVSETPDGWICEVDIVKGAKSDNTFYFQFYYDGSDDMTVQVEKAVALPI